MKTIVPILLVLCTLTITQASKFSGPSDVKPLVTGRDIRIVRRARQILNSRSKWNRADNRVCPAVPKVYSLYCALEKATEEIASNFEHRGAVMQEARFVIDEVMARNNQYKHRLMEYNNDPKTTFADVQRVFTLIEYRLKKRLDAGLR